MYPPDRAVRRASICVGVLVAAWAATLDAAAPDTVTNSLGMKLVHIPAGTFPMGAHEDPSVTIRAFPYADREWFDGELPQHKVRISKPFLLGATEVTLGEFRTFCTAANFKTEAESDGQPSLGYSPQGNSLESRDFKYSTPGWPQTDRSPATYVSWNDARAFCDWLSKKEGKQYRLPTEAEWEYACRAGSVALFSFGDDANELVKFANVADQTRAEKFPEALLELSRGDMAIKFPYLPRRDGFVWTSPVDKFQPNAFGLHDMHGNVWEWCAD